MAVHVHKRITHTSSDGNGSIETKTVTEIPSRTELTSTGAERRNAWVWYVVGLIDLLVIVRWAFLLFGARSVVFAAWLYSVTDPLVAPFRGIFPSHAVSGA